MLKIPPGPGDRLQLRQHPSTKVRVTPSLLKMAFAYAPQRGKSLTIGWQCQESDLVQSIAEAKRKHAMVSTYLAKLKIDDEMPHTSRQ